MNKKGSVHGTVKKIKTIRKRVVIYLIKSAHCTIEDESYKAIFNINSKKEKNETWLWDF